MKVAPPDLATALTDVRRAYRLLHSYHRRLCDLLQRVDEALTETGLVFESWEALNVARLPKSSVPFFHRWAWDLTPAYQVRCEWRTNESSNAHLRVCVDAIADTGYAAISDDEPDALSFQAEEACRTELAVGIEAAIGEDPDWNGAWKKIERLPNWDDGSTRTVEYANVKYSYRQLKVDLVALGDRAAVESKLLAPIREWLARCR